jgi:gamma-glutamylcyclotransferase (GGCT)/AIG2-like uncharacterized protein YtfP
MNIDLPLFVYGALKQGELAHRIISPLLSKSPVMTQVDGFELMVVDGIALAIKSKSNSIEGELAYFENPALAYKRITDFEDVPGLYHFEEVSALGESANILVASNERLKTRYDKITNWTGAQDGLLAYGIPWSYERLENLRLNLRDTSRDLEFWMAYHDLQSTFQLLWSIVERILLFHDGTKNRDMPLGEKISWLREMQKHPDLREAVEKVRIDTQMGVRSNRKPEAAQPHRTGTFGFAAWYEMRNNVVHRGKSTRVENGLLWSATVDLHNTIAYFLAHNSEPINSLWTHLTSMQKLSYDSWLYRIRK